MAEKVIHIVRILPNSTKLKNWLIGLLINLLDPIVMQINKRFILIPYANTAPNNPNEVINQIFKIRLVAPPQII